MKGSLAAMLTACERFLAHCRDTQKELAGSLAFLITSDEEGPAADGTRAVIERLQERSEHIDHCVVGEPSSRERLGDVIKIGRRGSLHGRLVFHGIQGHIAYPQLARNPVHESLAPLMELCDTVWDQGNEGFPPTSFQISNIHAGTGADNVIPGDLEVIFNFRYSTESTRESLRERTDAILTRHGMPFTLTWKLSGEPFVTLDSPFVDRVAQCITSVTGVVPERSTSGGTSDGRFIAPTGTRLVELGPCNASIHKIDEHVRAKDLDTLSVIYERIMTEMLLDAG
jgi:succinyl-diaminopimelate desuccinylase